MRFRGRTRIARLLRAAVRRDRPRQLPGWVPSELSWWIRVGGISLTVALISLACAPAEDARLMPRSTMFVGIDISGSFEDDGRYDDAMAFASRYIYGHLQGKAELEQPRALFVGAIGGETPGEPQAFHPIHDFEGKTPSEIEADLREWFAPDDRYTDFDAFFRRAATLVQRQNLALAPITLVLLTDGVPDLGSHDGAPDGPERYQRIDLEPLEYLARNVTVRVLYPDPSVAVRWEQDVPRDRVRMWTVDDVVMRGWRDQLRETDMAAAESGPGSDSSAYPTAIVEGGPKTLDSTRVAVKLAAADPTGGARTGETGGARTGETGGVESDAPVYGADPRVGRDRPEDEMRGLRVPEPSADTAAAAGDPDVGLVPQPELWRWIQDNVDFRVGRRVF